MSLPRRRRIRHVGEPTYPHLGRSGCSGFSRKRFVGSYRLSISGAGVSPVGPGWAWRGSIAELPLPGSCDGNRQLGRREQRSRCGFVTTVSKPPRDHRGTHFIDAAAEQLDTGLYLRVCSSRAGTRTHNLRINRPLLDSMATLCSRVLPSTSRHVPRNVAKRWDA